MRRDSGIGVPDEWLFVAALELTIGGGAPLSFCPSQIRFVTSARRFNDVDNYVHKSLRDAFTRYEHTVTAATNRHADYQSEWTAVDHISKDYRDGGQRQHQRTSDFRGDDPT